MSNILSENWHKYAPCLPTGQAGPGHFVTMWDYMQRNKFRCYRTLRAYGSVDSVKVNGPGIPKEIKDKIFQPFFTTKPTGSGTGLGLSLAYDIVKAHGGALQLADRVKDGTTFTITLPIN